MPVSQPAQESPAPQPPWNASRLFAYRRLLVLILTVFALDQLTKYWINAHLPLGSYGYSGITVIPGFLNLVHVGNTGAAWSMFSGKSTGLALLAAGTLFAIFFWRKHLALKNPSVQLSFGLLCGGIIGNLVDRLVHGHVIDFVDVHFGSYTYPTFNVADSGICIGVFWYVLWSLRNPPAPT
ncbi:MAG: signal peptidase II, partial [Lacunisphaera sp.]